MIPKLSPYLLVQETLFPDEWKILVSCICLNRTTRASVDKVLPKLFSAYPDALSLSNATESALCEILAPLGFKNRRAKTLIELSKNYLNKTWMSVSDLPGIGKYGEAAWKIFCAGEMPDSCPEDHALKMWWNWNRSNADR